MLITLILLKSLVLILPIVISVAFFTLLERKFISYIQRRRGPNVVGPLGLLQAIADGVKLIFKETIIPSNANLVLFIFSPILTFSLSLITWAVVPFSKTSMFVNLDLGLMFILAISSLGVYGIIMSGWSSNSRWAFLGALRSAAQMVSYEVSMALILISVLISAGTLNLPKIVMAQYYTWYCLPHFPMFVLFCITCLAETNRHPFDFAEAESELVSGYNVEYASMTFALFFLAEYSSMLLLSVLTAIFFLGGWLAPFNLWVFQLVPPMTWLALKSCIFIYGFIAVRAFYPRLRYDQLMQFCWKVSLPIALVWVVFTAITLSVFDMLPPAGGLLAIDFDLFEAEYSQIFTSK